MAKFDGTQRAPGRPKGSPNRLGRLARENIVAVFEQLGGIDAMTGWARENPTEFYARVYTRLIPSEAHITTDPQRAVQELSDAELLGMIERLRRAMAGGEREDSPQQDVGT